MIAQKYNARNNSWELKNIKDLKRKDMFRLLDDDKHLILDPLNGDEIYVAATDSYLDENNEWTIKTL